MLDTGAGSWVTTSKYLQLRKHNKFVFRWNNSLIFQDTSTYIVEVHAKHASRPDMNLTWSEKDVETIKGYVKETESLRWTLMIGSWSVLVLFFLVKIFLIYSFSLLQTKICCQVVQAIDNSGG